MRLEIRKTKALLKSSLEFTAAQLGPHRFRQRDPKLWILMYHRILPANDPRHRLEEPGMIVEPDTFRQHLKLLKELFTLMPLEEWVDRNKTGKSLPDRACAITFDDGWVDNFEFALPILNEEQVPASLFAVSDMIGTNRQFWPNRLTNLLAENSSKQLLQFDWLSAALQQSLKYHQCGPELAASVIQQLKLRPDNELLKLISNTEQILGSSTTENPAIMGWEQLKTMASNPLITIGSHTCNHFRLRSDLCADVTEDEIVTSKHRLQDELGVPINLFCYPNGDCSPLSVELVKKHYQGAVTTSRGINNGRSAPHLLSRIGVHQQVSNSNIKLGARLSNWL